MKFKSMLVLGLEPNELEHLKQGQPLTIRLDDVGLKGQLVQIVTGDSAEKLKHSFELAARKLETGSIIDLSRAN